MTPENHKRVRAYLMGGPGPFFGNTIVSVLQQAWGHSGGLNMSLGDFTDTLHTLDMRPEQLGRRWLLRLPDRPSGRVSG